MHWAELTAHAPCLPGTMHTAPLVPSSVALLQLLSTPSQTSFVGMVVAKHEIAPLVQVVVPSAHAPN